MALQTRSDMELWDRPFQTLLLGVLGVNVLAHMFYVPWWVIIACFIALGWKLGHLYFGWPLPKRLLLYSIGVAVGGGIIFEYKTMLGHEAATPILVFLASLKLLETNRDRDAKFIIVTSYFLLMAHLLHSQTLASTFFMAFDVALITILMFQLHRADRRVTQRSLRPVVRLLIVTIPIWLCLFIVFPRFTIKTFRKNTTVQTTGFNEGLNPGSVSGLAQSDELAFRVQFISGPRRSPESLYWRGATLYEADGMKWTPRFETETRRTAEPLSSLPATTGDNVSKYEIVTEPGQAYTVFTLPRVVGFEPSASMTSYRPFLTNDHLIRMTVPRTDHAIYTVSSVGEEAGELETLSPAMSMRTRTVSGPTSQEFRKLVNELKSESISIHYAMSKIDEWFAENDFRYTLTPGDAKSLSIDDFLFKNKKGFCEHYAAASATLLRAMGFSARVVVGYQGGKWNAVSKALMVRSRDAHAWVEVWTPARMAPGKGRWITYDPTASIAPLRLRLGGDFLDLPEEQRTQNASDTNQNFQKLSESFALRAFDHTMMLWDYAQMSWTQFLLGYDQSGQRNLLNQIFEWLGLTSRPWLISGLMAAFLGVALRLLYLWHTRNSQESAIQREWNYLEKELTRLGVVKSIADGPLTLRDRIKSETVRDGIDAFIALQYESHDHRDNQFMRQNLRLVRRARREAKRMTASPLV